MPTQEQTEGTRRGKRLPLWFAIFGALLITATALLAARIIWERTWLTWHQGPQMIGFALAHGYFAILMLAPPLIALWLMAALITIAVWKLRRFHVARQAWVLMGLASSMLVLTILPQTLLDTLFVSQLAKSSHAQELMVYAAGNGESLVVRGMLRHGVPVNGTDHEGDTALHFAAAAGENRLVSLLLDRGAAVNAVNLYGDSPLLAATQNHRDGTAQLLKDRGGRVLQGDEQQRARAAHDIVQRNIEEQERERRAAGEPY